MTDVDLLIDEDAKRLDEWRMICFLRCPECHYLELPGCSEHQVLFSRPIYKQSGELKAVACESCHQSTATTAPYDTSCRRCHKTRAEPKAWVTHKGAIHKLGMASPSINEKDYPTALLYCEKCQAVEFPVNSDSLCCIKEKRLWDSKKVAFTDLSQFTTLRHAVDSCRGGFKMLPVLLSSSQVDFVREHFVATQAFNPKAPSKVKECQVAGRARTTRKLQLFWEKEKYTDVTLSVGTRTLKLFTAHRMLLALRSQVFAAMFFSQFAEASEKEVTLQDVEPDIFGAMLHYMYTDEIDIDETNVLPYLFAANRYQIDGLRKLCVEWLELGVTAENVLTVLEATPNLIDEEKAVLTWAADHAKDVLMSDAFLHISSKSVSRFAQCEQLNCLESDLWRGIVRWAEEQVKQEEKREREAAEAKSRESKEEKKGGPERINAHEDALLSSAFANKPNKGGDDVDAETGAVKVEKVKLPELSDVVHMTDAKVRVWLQVLGLPVRGNVKTQRSRLSKALQAGERPKPQVTATKQKQAVSTRKIIADQKETKDASTGKEEKTKPERKQWPAGPVILTVDPKKLSPYVEPLMKYVRFPLLKAQEVALLVTPVECMETAHQIALYRYLCLPRDKRSKDVFPDDFAYSFEKRTPNGTILTYEKDFDENGFVYYIGTQGASRAFVNPANTKAVTITGTGTVNGNLAGYFGREPPTDNFHQYNTPGHRNTITIDFGEHKIAPTHYTLRHNMSHATSYICRNWVLEASNDGVSWDVLKAHSDDAGIAGGATLSHTWEIESTGEKYSRFRTVQTGPTNNGTPDYWMCNGIEFYGNAVFGAWTD